MSEVVFDRIVKTYQRNSIRALDDVSFSADRGSLFGLIGPDGAGKTSIFRILATLTLPDRGQARVSGWDVVKDYSKIRQVVGYMPGRFSLYPDLSVGENLSFFAALFNTTVQANYDLIKDIYRQIEPFKKRRAGALSGGMKQKLALCCALIHRPSILFLDEPTTGVDAVSRKEFWQTLGNLRKQGITILVSTPYMDEAARCENIALIQNGKILSINTPQKIAGEFPETLFAVRSNNMSGLLRDLRGMSGIGSCYTFGEFHHITFRQGIENPQKWLVGELESKHHHEIEFMQVQPTIEDCFIRLMKKDE
ncbi:MAG: ABC transporter ATP-binding protein [Bacteroidia bacterium]|nr:ABC transporter ATP-binding protein [Bacteroidia bacterium]